MELHDRGYLNHVETAQMKGKRIEIPVHFDLWMRGARFGEVRHVAKDGSFVKVKMDNRSVRKLVRINAADFEFTKLIARISI